MSNVPVLDPEIVTRLRHLVAAYHETDTHVRTAQTEMQRLKKEKNELSVKICDIMRQLGLEDIKYSDSTLRYSTRKVTLPATRATIKQRLQTLFDDDENKARATDIVLAPRGIQERVGIRRVRIRT
jgi:seryl-tRNA synthetase